MAADTLRPGLGESGYVAPPVPLRTAASGWVSFRACATISTITTLGDAGIPTIPAAAAGTGPISALINPAVSPVSAITARTAGLSGAAATSANVRSAIASATTGAFASVTTVPASESIRVLLTAWIAVAAMPSKFAEPVKPVVTVRSIE